MNKIFIAFVTSIIVFLIYEKTRNDLNKSLQLDNSYTEDIEMELRRLVDIYYNQYIYPHKYPQINFVIPSSFSATRGSTIHLLIHDPYNNELFDRNTILQVGAHECAHALCGVEETNEHGKIFSTILSRLNELGKNNNIFSPDIPIPKRYLQLCL